MAIARYALRFGSDVYRFIFAAKPPRAKATPAKLRRLTLEEIQAARPLRTRSSPCNPATPWSHCHTGSWAWTAAERFRVLNGLEAHAQAKAREEMKAVLD